MRLSKKQQAIVEILKQRGTLAKHLVFEALEGEIEDKKIYRSRYNSFIQTLKKLVEKGALEWQGDSLALASETTQTKVKKTQEILEGLAQLREAQQSLTLANLSQWTSIRDWLESIAEWKLSLPRSEEHRRIDLDAILDDTPEMIDFLLPRLEVDLEKILSSGLIFNASHHQQFQRKIHTQLCEKIRKFSIPHKTLKTTIEAKLSYQSSQKTICELIEAAIILVEEEKQQILDEFKEPYLKQVATRRLATLIEAHIPLKSQLKHRFPGFFSGNWEWDRLYQQLLQKVSDHAETHGLYQTPEEWKLFLKRKARHRFQQAQQSQTQGNPQAPPRPRSFPPLDTCYQLLGLEETKDLAEIRGAFRKLAKVHHPDQGGNPEFFRSLNQAYTRLLSFLESQ